MDLTGKNGALKFRGHGFLFIVISLLVSEVAPQAAEEDAGFLKLRLSFLENKYRELCKEYSSVASNCSVPAITCSECPDNWLQVGDQCFALFTDKDEWHKSVHLCRDSGGHLAILTTREQHEAVQKEGRRIGGLYTHYWIGLNDIKTEGDWRWVNDTALGAQTYLVMATRHSDLVMALEGGILQYFVGVLETRFWNINEHHAEPDNSESGGPDGEDCVVVNSFDQTWFDVPCSFSYPRVCQKAATPLQ